MLKKLQFDERNYTYLNLGNDRGKTIQKPPFLVETQGFRGWSEKPLAYGEIEFSASGDGRQMVADYLSLFPSNKLLDTRNGPSFHALNNESKSTLPLIACPGCLYYLWFGHQLM